jgi:hypothetical protein
MKRILSVNEDPDAREAMFVGIGFSLLSLLSLLHGGR